jgi:hypothetical protein
MPNIVETLTIPNFSQNNVIEKLILSADAAANQAIINVLNSADIFSNDFLILSPGENTGEIHQINTNVSNVITFFDNLLLQHRVHESIIKVFGDKIQVYRAANVDGTVPPDSAFSVYGAVVPIIPNQPASYFTDTAGGINWWYKFAYYNSTSGALTDISFADAIRGGGYGNYCSISDILIKAGLDASSTDLSIVAKARSASQSEVKGSLSSAGYTMPLQTGGGILFVPDHIADITALLAAGILLFNNYSTTKPSAAKDGKAKMDEARQMIAKIQLRDTMLVDSNDQDLALAPLATGWPDNTTCPPQATMDKIF